MDKRSGLALVLCLGIFIGWMWLQPKLFPPPPAPAKPPVAEKTEPSKADPPKSEPAKTDPVKTEPAPSTAQASKYEEKPPITLSSKYLEVVLTNKGAGVERVTLHFPKEKDSVPILQAFEPAFPHLAVRHIGGPDAIESLPWEIVDQKPDRAEFRYRLRNGVEVTKILALEKDRNGDDRHTLVLTLMLDNKNPVAPGSVEPADQSVQLEILAINGIDPDSVYRYDQYLTAFARVEKSPVYKPLAEIEKGESKLAEALRMPEGKERSEEVKSVEDKFLKVTNGHPEWFGVKNRFFTAFVNPDTAALDATEFYEFRHASAAAAKNQAGRKNISATARTRELRVGGGRKVLQYTLYCGPLDKDVLHEVPGAEDLGAYSGGCILGFVVKPAAAVIMGLLKVMSQFLRNTGLGIIFTTLLIRLCLFPLSLKSQRNALAMQALGPKIQALKERYKDDQQKYGIEQMRLFKENKVNPVAGCLPVFIQMPIFIGMYSVFEMSIDLRHAPFFAWIHDLSEPDRLLGPWTPVVIPLLITDLRIDALNLLPILMTITWFLQAYFTPRSPDPQTAQQQKMMMYMPIIFGLTCYGLASGLSLYFLANSLLSMGEQKIIKRYILKVGPDGKPLARAPEALSQ